FFTAPHPTHLDPIKQRQIRLISLMSIISAIVLLVGLVASPDSVNTEPLLISLGMMGIIYGLSRSAYATWAGYLLLLSLTIPSTVFFLDLGSSNPSIDFTVYSGAIWLALPIVLSGLILQARGSSFVSTVILGVMLLIKFRLAPNLNDEQFWNSWAFLTTLSVIMVVSSLVREYYLIRPQINAMLEAQAQLKESNDDLRRADRVKDEFLATMSHELRTPLNSVIGYSSILRDGLGGELDEEALALVAAIENSSQHLLTLITDILDISKIGAGKVMIHMEQVNLRQLASTWEQTFAGLARKKGLRLQVRVADSVPQMIGSDAGRLTQIVTNLLSNAIKFTDQGFVALVIGYNAENLIIRVQDTGIGIPEDQLNVIFEKFRQVNASSNRRHEGTGLGLAITKRLVELFGGRITVNSKAGYGTQFTVFLPNSDAQLPLGG
ncbi:MAG: hypothetical protein KC496_18130, partial [Anaerolineae bacterium]|nr:hypothetical protein [Anaerolineae bacterium]